MSFFDDQRIQFEYEYEYRCAEYEYDWKTPYTLHLKLKERSMKTIGAAVIFLLIVGELIFIAATSRDTTAESDSTAGIVSMEIASVRTKRVGEATSPQLPSSVADEIAPSKNAVANGEQIAGAEGVVGPKHSRTENVAEQSRTEDVAEQSRTEDVAEQSPHVIEPQGRAKSSTSSVETASFVSAVRSDETNRGSNGSVGGTASLTDATVGASEAGVFPELFSETNVEASEPDELAALFGSGGMETQQSEPWKPEWISSEAYAAVSDSVVQIVSTDGALIGNGVVTRASVSEKTIEVLTAAHVTDSVTSLLVRFATSATDRSLDDPSGLWSEGAESTTSESASESRQGKVEMKDASLDLALVRVSMDSLNGTPRAVRLSSREHADLMGSVIENAIFRASWLDARAGLEFEKLGSLDHSIVRREVGAPEVGHWELPIRSESGMSGGPLFDSNGDLIGIASGNSRGRAYYVDLSSVRAFLVKAQRRSGK